jgi:crotonobetainyl-CoA:carnitine CoA-transferase CaiB-like acyl-CoA transferase
MCDVMGALTAAEGVLAGLVQRELEGRGCRVDTSLLSGAMALQAPVLDRMASGREDGRLQGRPLWGCFDCPLETTDGYVVVTVEDGTALCRLAAACGVDDSTPRGPATEGAVAAALRTHPSSTWEASLRAAGVPCAAVRTDLATLPTDPALAGRFEPLEGCWAPARPWAFTYGHGVAAGSSAARTSPEPPEPASTEAQR